jgi:hypothetical protein
MATTRSGFLNALALAYGYDKERIKEEEEITSSYINNSSL